MNIADIQPSDELQDHPVFTVSTGHYVVRLLPLAAIRPHEEHDHACAVQLSQAIATDGYASRPVLVEERTMTLLDGHHRVAALTMLGCRFVPCVLVDYGDPRVTLEGWRPELAVDRDMVLTAARHGPLLPKKSTRHRIEPDLDPVVVALSLLNSDRTHGN